MENLIKEISKGFAGSWCCYCFSSNMNNTFDEMEQSLKQRIKEDEIICSHLCYKVNNVRFKKVYGKIF